MAKPQISTMDLIFSMGFTLMGDSRDFTNSSIEMVFARGQERLTWVVPMKKAIVCVNSPDGGAILNSPVEQLSFDVVLATNKTSQTLTPPEG